MTPCLLATVQPYLKSILIKKIIYAFAFKWTRSFQCSTKKTYLLLLAFFNYLNESLFEMKWFCVMSFICFCFFAVYTSCDTPPRKMGDNFIGYLGNRKFSPTFGRLSQMGSLKFFTFIAGDKWQSLLKFACLFQVKLTFLTKIFFLE